MSVTAFPDSTEQILRALPLAAGDGIAALAARLGTDRETTMRALEALADEGLVAVDGGALVLTPEGSELLRD